MKRSIKNTVLLAAMLAVVAPFAMARADGLALQTGSKLWLTGSSTMHEFSSTASDLKATFQHDPALWPQGGVGDAIEGLIRSKGVTSLDLSIGVTGMHSGKDGLDKRMYKSLLAEKHPRISFHMGAYEIAEGASTEMSVRANGKVGVAGVEKDVQITAVAKREGDQVRLRGEVPLLMTQFGVKPPTMMMGALKTRDQVVVHFDLLIGSINASGAMSKAE